MTLFNIFRVCVWSKKAQAVGWLAGWLADGGIDVTYLSFFSCYLRISFSIRTSLGEETPFQVWGHVCLHVSVSLCVCVCLWLCSFDENTRIVRVLYAPLKRYQKCVCWRWVTMTILYERRRKKRNKVNGVANGQKEIDLKLQHIVRVWICVCVRVCAFDFGRRGSDTRPG